MANSLSRPHVEEWRWSSFQATAGFQVAPSWLGTDWMLSQIRCDRVEAQQVDRTLRLRSSGHVSSRI